MKLLHGWMMGLCLGVVSAFAGEGSLPGWRLVWSDEFDGAAIDPAKWRVEDAGLVKNNELQYYTPEEVYLTNGCLVIRSQRRPMGEREYTSGLVETRGKFAMVYGRYEIRAKLPRTQGLWPAHWMLPEDGSWPPEIDIMESVGSQPTLITMSLHNGFWPDLDSQTMDYIGPDYSADFHVYALEWEPGEIRWYIDGEQRFAAQDGVPQKPMYMILNTAVGGEMPGDPDETTVFPQFHEIDYVRIYGKDVPGTWFLTKSSVNGSVVVRPRENRYKNGSVVSLQAYPLIGYRFAGWGGDASGTENPLMVTMDSDKAIKADFEPDPNAPELLSEGKVARASSLEMESTGPENAVDGKKETRWSSVFSDSEWLYVDLGQSCQIEAVRIEWENAYAKAYDIQVSSDGVTWTSIHGARNSKGRVEDIVGIRAAARYVRLLGIQRGTEWGYSVFEFKVYGRKGSPVPEAKAPAQ